jgi:hypothetical protein
MIKVFFDALMIKVESEKIMEEEVFLISKTIFDLEWRLICLGCVAQSAAFPSFLLSQVQPFDLKRKGMSQTF